MRRSHNRPERPVEGLHMNRGTNNVPPFTPGFAWNGTFQEFIEILPEGRPDYLQNREILDAAIKRWNAGAPKK